MRPLRILNLEDDPLDAELVHASLTEGGIECEMVRVQTREEFVGALEGEDYDLILSDYSLPSFDGLSALRVALETRPQVPFIFVSGAIGEETAIESLKQGAIDYVLKQRLERIVPAVRRAVREADERAARRRAEEELRHSEERFRLLAEEAVEGIVLIEDAKIIDANRSCLGMFGYEFEELIGMEVIELSPPDLREEITRRMSAGNTEPYETRGLRKDGTTFPIEVRPRSIPYLGRQVRVSSVLDLTERKRTEQAMAEVREAERRRIARDLHDGVLQDLSYTVQALELTKLQAQGTPLEDELQLEVHALRSAAQELRAAVHHLRLADELEQPFPRLLESLVERNREMSTTQLIALEVKEGFPAEPLGEQGIEVLRILQEALTNARRHSGATNVVVSLKVEANELVVAEVRDDGRGMGAGRAPGVGMRSMRERAVAVGGELEVESNLGEGTTVRLRVPVPRRAQ